MGVFGYPGEGLGRPLKGTRVLYVRFLALPCRALDCFAPSGVDRLKRFGFSCEGLVKRASGPKPRTYLEMWLRFGYLMGPEPDFTRKIPGLKIETSGTRHSLRNRP